MFDMIDGFLISSIIYYLYKEKLIDKLISGEGINNNEIDDTIIDVLVLKEIFNYSNIDKKYFLTEEFLKNFNYIELGKIITLVGGYGENLIKLNEVLKTKNVYKNSIDIGKGSMYSGFKFNYSYVSKILDNKKKGTIIDLGCGSGDFLYILAEKYPNLDFIGIDLSNETIKKARNNKKIKNLRFLIGNILDENIYNNINNVILLTSFFVFHELIGEVDNYIKFISNRFIGSSLLIREFTPPQNISTLSNFNDNFVCSYLLFHKLSGQNTYTKNQWIKVFEKNKIKLNGIIDTNKYDKESSLYPLFEFKIGK